MLADCQPRVLAVEPPFTEATAALGEALDGVACVAVGPAPKGWASWQSLLARAAPLPDAPRPAGRISPVLLCYTWAPPARPRAWS